MAKTKKGRPFTVKNKRDKFSLSLTLAEGCMDKLFKRYGTKQNATAIREAILDGEIENDKDEAMDFMIKVGKAKISMKKNGDITISGGKINVKGSGAVAIKGSKITQN